VYHCHQEGRPTGEPAGSWLNHAVPAR
jgi:hypothetical protein